MNELLNMPTDELKKLRHTDFKLYKKIHSLSCYYFNKDYNVKKQEAMKKYYTDNREELSEKRRIYMREYYKRKKEAKAKAKSEAEAEAKVESEPEEQ